jgi:hypothetical protein
MLSACRPAGEPPAPFCDRFFARKRLPMPAFARCACLLCLLLLPALLHAQENPAPTATVTATATPDWPAPHFAPYVDMGAYPVNMLAVVAQEVGVRYFSLGFVQAQYRNCAPAWAGVIPIQQHRFLQDDLQKLRAAGGDVIISFGGAAGTELARACPDVDSLTAAYAAVVAQYQATHLDFDIEGDDLRDADSMARRSTAIARLQAAAAAAGRPLVISYTLPVLPTGLVETGLNALQLAQAAGVEIAVVNIMTMNFGDSFGSEAMGAKVIQAAESLVAQLADLYPEKSAAERWSMVGLTPMIGINDVMSDIFTPADAESVVAFARQQGLARLTMWSLERDKECISQQRIVSGKCSGTVQEPFAYARLLQQVMR